jgi:hypothetical protein
LNPHIFKFHGWPIKIHRLGTHDVNFSSNFHHNFLAMKNSKNIAFYFSWVVIMSGGFFCLVTGRGLARTKRPKIAR